jgi:hypothetical protein
VDGGQYNPLPPVDGFLEVMPSVKGYVAFDGRKIETRQGEDIVKVASSVTEHLQCDVIGGGLTSFRPE